MANLAVPWGRCGGCGPSFLPSFPPSKDAHPSQEHTCMPIHVACSADVSQGVAPLAVRPAGSVARGESRHSRNLAREEVQRRPATTTQHAFSHPCHASSHSRTDDHRKEGRNRRRKEGRLGRKDCWRRPFRPSSSAAAAAMRTSDWTVTGHKGSTFAYGKLRTVDVGKQTVCRNQVLTLSRLIN